MIPGIIYFRKRDAASMSSCVSAIGKGTFGLSIRVLVKVPLRGIVHADSQ